MNVFLLYYNAFSYYVAVFYVNVLCYEPKASTNLQAKKAIYLIKKILKKNNSHKSVGKSY